MQVTSESDRAERGVTGLRVTLALPNAGCVALVRPPAPNGSHSSFSTSEMGP